MCTILFDFNYVQLKTFILISLVFFSTNLFYQKSIIRSIMTDFDPFDIFRNKEILQGLNVVVICADLFFRGSTDKKSNFV